jgi:exonuclease SbcC
MIPQRVKMSGFLSYREEQELRFDGASLWMLTGANGSGKSSVFDAVTYALFGCHRGGSQNAAELINRSSSTLSVEFDFLLDSVCHRIKRTLRQLKNTTKSTVQVLRQDPDGTWNAVSGTDQKLKFDAWIREKIGLDYETFTSSVLLLQGKAEKLLDATPTGRAGVLARIVDLERYQKLHAQADEKRKAAKLQLENLTNQLAGLRLVTDEEYTAAVARIEEVDCGRMEVQARIDSLQALELQALRWADAQDKLETARDKLRTAEAILSHAVAIERDYARLRELHDVLPAVTIIVTERSRIAESLVRSEQLQKQRAARADSRAASDHALKQARDTRDRLRKTLADDEAKQTRLNSELRELSAVLEKVRQADEAQAEVNRLAVELKRFPTDLDTVIGNLEEEQTRLAAVGQAVPLLDRLHQERTALIQAMHKEAAARMDEERLLKEGTTAKEESERLAKELATATATREAAAAAMAEARALAHQAKQLAEEFKKLTGEKNCAACGQELTPEHFELEKKRRDLNAKAAERKFADFTKQATEAREKEDALIEQDAAARTALNKLREEFKDRANEAKQAAADIARLAESCRTTYFALPEPFKQKIGPRVPDDWSKVEYPDRQQLAALRTEAAGIEDVKRKLREATLAANSARTARAQHDTAVERLEKARLGLPAGDSTALRQSFTAKQAEDAAVSASIKGAKSEIAKSEADMDRHQRLLSEADRDLVEIDGKRTLEESSRKQSQEAIDRATRTLPPAWRGPLETAGLGERTQWQNEYDRLEGKGTESKYTQLQAARGGLDSLRAEITLFEEEAAAFPEDARRSPDSVKADLAAARAELDAKNTELLDAQRQRSLLDDYRAQRAELGEKSKACDAEFNRWKRLAELLGRDRLQRHLVRKAERQIIDCSNGVLDRLSDGQLFLKIVGSEDGTTTDKALELECVNRATGAGPINVSFISGSQRFRVAVALALGIGQYASRQVRPIESVIIDEGFGCLDRANRQVMIQELQNLRGHLKSILLVSHQEEFADAFPDGYRFELVNGATRATRIRR